MMKKIIVLIALACFCAGASAEVVSVSDIRTHAGKFFGSRAELSPIASDRIIGSRQTSEAPTFYVINNPSGGWVIISAEDSSSPILACSETGSFPLSGFSPATGRWLSDINTGIRTLRKSHARASKKTKAQWASIGASTKADNGEVILSTAKWGQDTPFNNLCPKIGEQYSVTGCIATAMAIVCRFHEWPAQGANSTDAYYTTTRNIPIASINLSSHTYDWSSMPLVYDENPSSAQKSAVAKLMYDCGAMVHMDYNLAKDGGSGAFASEIPFALKKYLSYSVTCRMVASSHMDSNDWFSTVKAEIDAQRPLIYTGVAEDKEGNAYGHAFVCDGYDGRNMLHINWGWKGNCDGFFAMTWLGDDGDPTVSGNVGYVFSNFQEIILGIKPAGQGDPTTEAAELFLASDENASGIMFESGSLVGGGSFTISTGRIMNNSAETDYSGKLKAVLLDRSGNVKEDLCDAVNLEVQKSSGGKTVGNIQCRIDGTVAPGDAVAIMYTLPDGSWVRMGGDPETEVISLYGIYDACFIANPDNYDENVSIYPSLVQGHSAVKNVKWYFDGREMTKGFVSAETGEHKLKAEVTFVNDVTETVVHPITVN